MKKVLVAMSGGVDSSAAVAILQERGYCVSGATMRLFDGSDCVAPAKKVAEELGIEHFVFDFSAQFERDVIVPFCESYVAGETPNPCVFCNKNIKFGAFYRKAMEMGFDYIATGHYAKVKEIDGRYFIKPADTTKDQTYVLYNLNQEILSRLLLPAGDFSKEDIREYAKKAGISVAETPDSQEICFIPDNDYINFLESRGYKTPRGDFVDVKGNVIGTHKGISNYTVGQRKGLGSFGSPKYVLDILPEKNQVVLGENSELFSDHLICDEVNFLSGKIPSEEFYAFVKIRYGAKPARAKINMISPHKADILFETPCRAITVGQSAVFYDEGVLLGGGIIIRKS